MQPQSSRVDYRERHPSLADALFLPRTKVHTKYLLYVVSIVLYLVVGVVALSDRTPKVFLPASSYVTPQGVRVTVDNDRVSPSATCFRVVIANKFSSYLVVQSDAICTSAINPGEQADLPVPMAPDVVAKACTWSADPWSNCSVRVENLFAPPVSPTAPPTGSANEPEPAGRSGVSTYTEVPNEISSEKP